VLAWAYTLYGRLPQAGAILYGVKPAVMGIIAVAAWRLARSALVDRTGMLFFAGVLVASLLRADDVLLLLTAGVLMVGLEQGRRLPWWGLLSLGCASPALVAGLREGATQRMGQVFLYFLKIGAVLYGSGLVLYAFVERDVVARYGWLSPQQLIDAIAAGQVTPGPVLSSATFIGYLIAGPQGALVATLGVFLPSFFFVALTGPWIPRLRTWRVGQAFLRGATVAALALIVKTALYLGQASLIDPPTILIALTATALLWRCKVDPMWVIAGGAAVGLARLLLT